MTDYDISLLVDGSVQWTDVAQTVRSIKSELLHGAAFVDEYRGKQVPAGKKSLTLRLAIGSEEQDPDLRRDRGGRLRRAQQDRQALRCGSCAADPAQISPCTAHFPLPPLQFRGKSVYEKRCCRK